MEIKEVFVARENPADIFSIIEEELSTNPDTQVFIDNNIFYELRSHGRDYNVSSPNYSKCPHYCEEVGEHWLALQKGYIIFDKVIARGSFISNCNEYMQLVEFHSSKIKHYTHYLAGFNQLLLILVKSES